MYVTVCMYMLLYMYYCICKCMLLRLKRKLEFSTRSFKNPGLRRRRDETGKEHKKISDIFACLNYFHNILVLEQIISQETE